MVTRRAILLVVSWLSSGGMTRIEKGNGCISALLNYSVETGFCARLLARRRGKRPNSWTFVLKLQVLVKTLSRVRRPLQATLIVPVDEAAFDAKTSTVALVVLFVRGVVLFVLVLLVSTLFVFVLL